MEFKRDIYLNQLIRKKHNKLIKVITGIRRCGKTYLLNTIFRRYLLDQGVPENHIIAMAFDLEENLEYCKAKPFILWAKARITDDNPYYFLLDEVQKLENFVPVLNSLNSIPNVHVFVSGSNARFLSKDIDTEFSGRSDEIHMLPLSFSEFISQYDGDTMHGFQEYMLYGGIPQVVLSAPEDKPARLRSLLSETYLKDIVRRHNVRNSVALDELLSITASDIGTMTVLDRLANTFHSRTRSPIKPDTVGKYLGYFEDSFLVESAQRYDVRGKRFIAGGRKYYFSDPGLRNAQLNFRQYEPTHLLENVVFNELKYRGYDVDVGIVEITETEKTDSGKDKRVRKQLEIDFVCNKGLSKIYVQSAYSIGDRQKLEQETRPYGKVGDSFRKFIITNDLVPATYDEMGIMTMNIMDFLMDPNSLERG